MTNKVVALNFGESGFVYIGALIKQTKHKTILEYPIKVGHQADGNLLFTRAAIYTPKKYIKFNRDTIIFDYEVDSVTLTFYNKAVKFLKKHFTESTHKELLQYITFLDQQSLPEQNLKLNENAVRAFVAQTMKDLIQQAQNDSSLPGENLPTLEEQRATRAAEATPKPTDSTPDPKPTDSKVEKKKKPKIIN